MEEQSNDIAQELALLHTLSVAEFSRKVEQIARRGEFHPIENEKDIFAAIDEHTPDFQNLIRASRKAVAHGFRVYLLPNPRGTRSADFILERKGTFRIYDLKTVSGKASVRNRLLESIGHRSGHFQGKQPAPCEADDGSRQRLRQEVHAEIQSLTKKPPHGEVAF